MAHCVSSADVPRVGPGGCESSRCLWPIRMNDGAADAAGMTPGVYQGKHFLKFLIANIIRRVLLVENGRIQNSYKSRDSRQRVIVRESSWMWGCVCVWVAEEWEWVEVCVVVKPIFSSTVSQKTASQLFIMFVFLHMWCESSRSRWKGHPAADDQIRIQTHNLWHDKHLSLLELHTLVWQKLTHNCVAPALAITLTSPPLTLRGHGVTR